MTGPGELLSLGVLPVNNSDSDSVSNFRETSVKCWYYSFTLSMSQFKTWYGRK